MKGLLLVSVVLGLALSLPVPEFQEKSMHNKCFLKRTSNFSCHVFAHTTFMEIPLLNARESGTKYTVEKFGFSEDNEYFIRGSAKNGWWSEDYQLVFKEKENGDCSIDAKSQSKWFSFLPDWGTNYCNLALILDVLGYESQELYNCEDTVPWSECL